MKVFAILTCAVISLVSCSSGSNEADLALFEIQKQVQKEVESAYPATVTSAGVMAMHGFREIDLGFRIQQKLTVDEARRIMVDCSERLLRAINANTQIRPYLVVYPFTPAEIGLSFSITDGTYEPKRTPGVLMGFYNYQGEIEYETINEEGPFRSLNQVVIMHRETLDEARKIVANEKK